MKTENLYLHSFWEDSYCFFIELAVNTTFTKSNRNVAEKETRQNLTASNKCTFQKKLKERSAKLGEREEEQREESALSGQ